jgi:hypothetical protein
MAKSNPSTATQSTESEVNIIDQLLEAVSATDASIVEQLVKSYEDKDLLRPAIALAVLETAHNMGYLKSVKSASTMRELMYNLVAHKTQKSISFHKENEAKPADTLKDIMADKNAVLVFSSMYPKVIQSK